MPESAWRIAPPILCLVVGVPASGKTVLARELARRLADAAYLSKDLIETPFTDAERVAGATYSLIQGPTYRILVDFADVQLGLGKTPILDAPFSINHARDDGYRDWVPPFAGVARRRGARLAIVRCLPPSEDALKARIAERLRRNESKWDAWKLAHWEEFRRREPLRFPIPHDDVCEFLSEEPLGDKIDALLSGYLRASEARA